MQQLQLCSLIALLSLLLLVNAATRRKEEEFSLSGEFEDSTLFPEYTSSSGHATTVHRAPYDTKEFMTDLYPFYKKVKELASNENWEGVAGCITSLGSQAALYRRHANEGVSRDVTFSSYVGHLEHLAEIEEALVVWGAQLRSFGVSYDTVPLEREDYRERQLGYGSLGGYGLGDGGVPMLNLGIPSAIRSGYVPAPTRQSGGRSAGSKKPSLTTSSPRIGGSSSKFTTSLEPRTQPSLSIQEVRSFKLSPPTTFLGGSVYSPIFAKLYGLLETLQQSFAITHEKTRCTTLIKTMNKIAAQTDSLMTNRLYHEYMSPVRSYLSQFVAAYYAAAKESLCLFCGIPL